MNYIISSVSNLYIDIITTLFHKHLIDIFNMQAKFINIVQDMLKIIIFIFLKVTVIDVFSPKRIMLFICGRQKLAGIRRIRSSSVHTADFEMHSSKPRSLGHCPQNQHIRKFANLSETDSRSYSQDQKLCKC